MKSKLFFNKDLSDLKISIDISEKKCCFEEQKHFEVLNKLKLFYNKMLKQQKLVKKKWKPAGEWLNYYKEKCDLYEFILKNQDNDACIKLKNFWRNELGAIVKEYAKFEDIIIRNTNTINYFKQSIGRNYLIWKDVFQQDDSVLRMDKYIGNPWGCMIKGILIAPKAIRYHTYAMQIKNLLSNHENPMIAEIGGGYGGLPYYLFKELKNCKYFNFDLPETLIICAYYLMLNFPEKKIFLGIELPINKNVIKKYDIFLIPNYNIEMISDKIFDVFFNSFSLSEMSPETNKAYIKEIARTTKYYFLHNNMDRKGVKNRGFNRIPASEYPIDKRQFKILYKNYDLFHSHFGDYKEFLYQCI
ncbi:MAG: hypothetical protein ACD_79C00090G0009 [uncultured bacterium]|nr:MAG: hypothetical protein ACD_79C00090G0009 [uncultured bacterium]